MENFLTVASQVAVLFVLMGAGAAMRRLRLIGEGAVDGATAAARSLRPPFRRSSHSVAAGCAEVEDRAAKKREKQRV